MTLSSIARRCARRALTRRHDPRGLLIRTFAASSEDLVVYAEEIQAAQIKPAAFYEEQGEKRNYFYHIDLQGRLFLEDVLPKNVATSLKSDKFLDFFWHMLRPNTLGTFEEYPFISPCGKEMNFVRPADTPIVFDRIDYSEPNGFPRLVYASAHSQEFDPSALVWHTETERIYHPVTKHKRLKGSMGLLRSHLGISLSERFVFENDGGVSLEWEDKVFPIRMIDNGTE